MVDEISPVMEDVVTETPAEPEATEQMSEESQLLGLLKEAAISKKEQLDGTIRNAKRTFEMQSERDRLANQLAQMEQRLAAAESKPKQSEPETDDYGQPIDLSGELNKILDARDKAKEREQLRQQQAMMGAWNRITQDEDFHLVKDVWEKKLQDPNFVFSIQMGQKNPLEEYQETLRGFFKGIAKQSVETIEKLQKGTAPKVHLESGDARTPEMVSDSDLSEHEETLKQLRESTDKGGILSEDDEMAAIQAALLK